MLFRFTIFTSMQINVWLEDMVGNQVYIPGRLILSVPGRLIFGWEEKYE
jgi:hypothetical protein